MTREEVVAVLYPKAKDRPGPYSRPRNIGYGQQEEFEVEAVEAKQEAQTNPYYASSESSRDVQPPLHPPTEDQRMKQLAAEHVPGYDPEPLVVSIAASDAGWQANLQWLDQMEGANMALDQLRSQVFWPIPMVVLGGQPVWKSQDGTMYWLFLQNPSERNAGT